MGGKVERKAVKDQIASSSASEIHKDALLLFRAKTQNLGNGRVCQDSCSSLQTDSEVESELAIKEQPS